MGDAEAKAALRSQGLDGTGGCVGIQIQFGDFRDDGLFLIGEEGQFWKVRKNVSVAVSTQVPNGGLQ